VAVTADGASGIAGLRLDESEVRLVFVVEPGADYAALVGETLATTDRARFEVRHAPRLDAAWSDIEQGDCDAVLVDLTTGPKAGAATLEDASSMAQRVPVIVLTGDGESPGEVEAADAATALRDRMAGSRLPEAILSAVRRSRRLGQGGAADPIVLRDPLRAFAAAFARLRRSLGR
jgi:DNA-binding response OmpR family regulator